MASGGCSRLRASPGHNLARSTAPRQHQWKGSRARGARRSFLRRVLGDLEPAGEVTITLSAPSLPSPFELTMQLAAISATDRRMTCQSTSRPPAPPAALSQEETPAFEHQRAPATRVGVFRRRRKRPAERRKRQLPSVKLATRGAIAQLGERLVRNPGARRAGEDGNPASASGSAGWSRLCTSPPIAPRYVRILLGFGHWIARGAHCEWWQRRVPGRRAGASRILIAFASGRLDERRVRR